MRLNGKILAMILFGSLTACTVTSRTAEVKTMGRDISAAEFKTILKTPRGVVAFQEHLAADWVVDRAGLINLDDPKAKAAGIKDGDEAIKIFFYEINHATRGTFLIDSGIAEKMRSNLDDYFPSMIQSAMNIDKLKTHLTIKSWLKRPGARKLKGVFLTHMHIDHIMGLPDFAPGTIVYTGLNETTDKTFKNMLVQGATDKFVGTNTKLVELKTKQKPSAKTAPFAPRIVDFLGDGSFFVVFVPGHTPGSLAYIVRGKDGWRMVTGDTCHTAWGWKNGVTPGDFTADKKMNQKSLNWLIALSKEFPAMKIHLGHQKLKK